MSSAVKMSVEARPNVGKGAARAARRAGYVPGVIYGAKKPPVTMQIKQSELLKILNRGSFYTTMFEIDVDGTKHRVIPKDMQKNKLNGLPEHIDFLRLAKGATVTVDVPVAFINEDDCPGLKAGGTLNVVRHTVELEVDADEIPDEITINLLGFNLGDGIHISSVTLPKGAQPTITDRDFTIATIATPSATASQSTDGDGEEGEASAEDGDAAES